MGEHLAAGVEDDGAAADRRSDLPRNLVQAPALEHQPLEALVDGDPAGENVVLLIHQAAEGRLGDRDERRLVGDLEDREVGRVRLRQDRLRNLGVVEAGPEAEAGDSRFGEQTDELPLPVRRVEPDPGGQQELAALQPRRRVEQLGDVDPADLALRRAVAPGGDLEAELGGEALDGQHRR
jgi:hypothetical protein